MMDNRYDPAEHGLEGQAGFMGHATLGSEGRRTGFGAAREPLFRVNGRWVTAPEAAAELRRVKS